MMNFGDIVLIQFGYNDVGVLNDDSWVCGIIKGIGYEQVVIDNLFMGKIEIVYSYGWYLCKMIGEVCVCGVILVICMFVLCKVWEDNGLCIVCVIGSYLQWVIQVVCQV